MFSARQIPHYESRSSMPGTELLLRGSHVVRLSGLQHQGAAGTVCSRLGHLGDQWDDAWEGVE